MNELWRQIGELSKAKKIALLALLIVLVLALDYSFLYSPQASRISDLNEQIANLQRDLDKKKRIAANRPKLLQQRAEAEARYKEATARLPAQKEIPELLRNISTRAREAGLEIILFRPLGENYQDFYAEIPIVLAARGDFHSVTAFFDELGRMDRIVNVHNVELKATKTKEERQTLEVQTQALTFRFLDQAERERIAAEKAAKEKAAKK
ncbi:MAG TPA: type 4a pilus biogenesis protein PilO [Candidatus Acidoferrales bacterium]|nr:type 4a pilus biogenesis protein PilO [Candidatus Acidoferrales bacterium]